MCIKVRFVAFIDVFAFCWLINPTTMKLVTLEDFVLICQLGKKNKTAPKYPDIPHPKERLKDLSSGVLWCSLFRVHNFTHHPLTRFILTNPRLV